MPRAKSTLLVIDDEDAFCRTVKNIFEGAGFVVLTARTGQEGLALCAEQDVDVVLLDQKLPDAEGHALAPEILEWNNRAKIIFITAFPTLENAVTAVRTRAYDYISKPFGLDELRMSVENAFRTLELERVEQVHRYEREREARSIGLAGKGLAGVVEIVRSAAGSASPVLITGETGTGKSLAAKAIHFSGSLPDAAFFTINCAAIPEGLIEAELFGHEKGAFTGAVSAKQGLFEVAEGGTLFLDEIGEMPAPLQAKLLNVLEDHVIRRVGGTVTRKVNVRIIAATNTDLEHALGRTFRNDLYYRLSVIRIHLPPLRERKEDMAELCSVLLEGIGGRKTVLADGEIARLQAYDWPGNVRELRNILERSLLVQKGAQLRPSLLLADRAGAPRGPLETPLCSGSGSQRTYREVEEALIRETLERQSGNVTASAKVLGISLSTLKRRIHDYGIKI
jgi:DNA-binding NtrC family response regulator